MLPNLIRQCDAGELSHVAHDDVILSPHTGQIVSAGAAARPGTATTSCCLRPLSLSLLHLPLSLSPLTPPSPTIRLPLPLTLPSLSNTHIHTHLIALCDFAYPLSPPTTLSLFPSPSLLLFCFSILPLVLTFRCKARLALGWKSILSRFHLRRTA